MTEACVFVSTDTQTQTWLWNDAWTNANPLNSPPPRRDFATHEWGGEVFGGRAANGQYLNDLWWYVSTQNNWVLQVPVNATYPSPRAFAAYGDNLLFGGRGPNGVLGDCWERRSNNLAHDWIPAPTGPSARERSALTHTSSGRKPTLLFGGLDANGVALDDTWLFDNGAWTQATPSTKPPARYGHTLVYDLHRNRVMLFGGFDAAHVALNDVWE